MKTPFKLPVRMDSDCLLVADDCELVAEICSATTEELAYIVKAINGYSQALQHLQNLLDCNELNLDRLEPATLQLVVAAQLFCERQKS